jgi:electron transfer flavoprotein alpha subunit
MTVLLFVEATPQGFSETARRALKAALQMGDVDLLVSGTDCDATATEAATFSGVGKVLVAQSPVLAGMRAETLSKLVHAQIAGYDGVVAAATAIGKNFMPRLAALCDVMQVSEAISVVAPDTFKRPIYAGNFIQTVKVTTPIRIVTIRTSAFEPAEPGGGAAAVVAVADVDSFDTQRAVLVEEAGETAERPDLGTARIVVSGGRALGSKERFEETIHPLAERLGAAVGASRAAVDAGFVTNDLQVGQTGKIVAPDLYIAIGISGAIQHLAGMKDSKVIVAINQDEDSPMVKLADYSLVGDLFEIVPQLTNSLAKPGT